MKKISSIHLDDLSAGLGTLAKGIENMISVLYTEGPKLAGHLREHVASYAVNILEGRRVASLSRDEHWKVALEGGESLSGRPDVRRHLPSSQKIG